MPIAVPGSRQFLADQYGTLGEYVGVATGDPGTTNVPANEAFGSGYARIQAPWTSGTGGNITGAKSVIQLPVGTFNYIILASDVSGDTMFDKCAVDETQLQAPGQVIVTASYQQL